MTEASPIKIILSYLLYYVFSKRGVRRDLVAHKHANRVQSQLYPNHQAVNQLMRRSTGTLVKADTVQSRFHANPLPQIGKYVIDKATSVPK